MKVILFLAVFAMPIFSRADVQHELIRRIAVFPVKADKALNKSADESWWQIREALTDNKRFLVASKNFLNNKSVYQARGALSPADAIILGRLLDAHVLVSTFVEERVLRMKVYEGQFGRTVWEHELLLHPSLPIDQQLPGASKKLILDFIASIPYQGYVKVDELIGRAAYKDGDRTLIQAEVGVNAQVEVGDTVQLIRVKSDSLKPLLGEGMDVEVFAEGRVVQVRRKSVVAEVLRVTNVNEIKANSLVRLPRELKRLRDLFAMKDSLSKNVDPTLLTYKDVAMSEKQREVKPLVAAVSYIANIALFLLLAF